MSDSRTGQVASALANAEPRGISCSVLDKFVRFGHDERQIRDRYNNLPNWIAHPHGNDPRPKPTANQ